jgi:hypothetical protein
MIRFSQFMTEGADATLADKAKKSGFSLPILKQVYKRGMAAWKVGHKPGTTPQQWGMARVNSFITGGRTRVKGDPDLWAKQKGKIRKTKKEDVNEAIKHTHAVVDSAGKVAGMTSNERDAKDIARRHKGKVVKLKKPMSTKKGDMMINRPFKEADSAAMKAFLARGGKITKLPPGKAAGYHGKDDPGKGMHGMMARSDTKGLPRKKVRSMK